MTYNVVYQTVYTVLHKIAKTVVGGVSDADLFC